MQGSTQLRIEKTLNIHDQGLTKFPTPNITQLPQKYDVMVQEVGFDSINNQEARSANIHLVKSKTVLVINGLRIRSYHMTCLFLIYLMSVSK